MQDFNSWSGGGPGHNTRERLEQEVLDASSWHVERVEEYIDAAPTSSGSPKSPASAAVLAK